MVPEASRQRVDGQTLKYLFSGGVIWLAHHAERINILNVFPVPDGDTGTNMLLTVRKAESYLNKVSDDHIGRVTAAIAEGARYGARGNSGTILSMLFQGFAQALKGHDHMDAALFAEACQRAVDYAYDTVRSAMEPREGTILTVARLAAAAVVERAQTNDSLHDLFDLLLKAAKTALDDTPNQLAVLKEAGVVDSGGAGLVALLEGIKRLRDGDDDYDSIIPELDLPQNGAVKQVEQDWEAAIVPDDERGYGYDVQFLMLGRDLDVEQVRRDISALGWSPLIDGNSNTVKVHIHVYNPAEPIHYAIQTGAELEDVVIENMQRQYEAYVAQRGGRNDEKAAITDEIAVIAVGRGAGLTRALREYGAAAVIEGGQTMNPSASNFVDVIKSLPNTRVVLLPNNGNIILAAREAAALSDKEVHVVPTKSFPQGIAALLAYSNHLDESLDEIVVSMSDATKHVRTFEVTIATRTLDSINGVMVNEGDYFALVDNQPAAADPQLQSVVLAALAKIQAETYELVTVYYGADVSEESASALIEALKSAYPMLEYECVNGGQPLYPYLLSVE
jgi:DAK2 domain fusion protein YloV